MMVAPVGKKKSTGRQRIEIKPIQDNDRRLTTFSKRKSGLFKKVSELSALCDSLVAAIVFSKTGKLYAHGTPSVDHVLRRAAPLPGEEDDALLAALDDADAVADREVAVAPLARQFEEARALVAAEQARMAAIGAKVLEAAAGKQFWWEADVEALGAEELPEFIMELQRVKRRLAAQKLPLVSAPLHQ